MSLLAMQLAAKAKHFHTGIYYKKLKALSIENSDEFEDGSIFKYGVITDKHELAYLGAHISIQQNDITIETYADLEFIVKGKVKIGSRLLQIKQILPSHVEVSPIAHVNKYTLTLG